MASPTDRARDPVRGRRPLLDVDKPADPQDAAGCDYQRQVPTTRETTPAMVARVTAALDERIGRALAVAAYVLREGRDSRVVDGGEGR